MNAAVSETYTASLPWSDTSDERTSFRLLHKSVRPEKLSDLELVIACQQGSPPQPTIFAELVRRHQAHVDKILYHLAPDWHDRHDLGQEVWIRIYRHLHRLQEPLKFRSWLGRIATNLFYDELRKRKRHQIPLSLDAPIQVRDSEIEWDLPSDTPNPQEHLTTQEFYEHLHQAVRDLPDVFRQTIILREIQGMSYEEIAERTGVSLGTVKSRIARARARLQSTLKPYLDGD
ncbi:MAG: sigma-70 family RNA polymerase sigma factor [Cyanobacteriota bacterium]|nr:sigma-70 family RNA polymerase sigma factor [Cyanobacteriota bacterium]